MGVLTSIGSLIGFYIMGMAVLSPCPLLVNDTSGAVVIVSTWDQFVFISNIRSILFFFCLICFIVYFCIFTWSNLVFSGVGMVLFHLHPILCKSDCCCHLARWRPQRSCVVWICGAVGLNVGGGDYVSFGQYIWLFHLWWPVQH